MQDGITAFEALESGVLHPLRELLVWLEGAAAGAATRPPRLTAGAKVAAELERDAVGALALVPSPSVGLEAKGKEAGDEAAGSVAVVEVGSASGGECSCCFVPTCCCRRCCRRCYCCCGLAWFVSRTIVAFLGHRRRDFSVTL